MKKLTKEQKRDIAAIAAKRDTDIDFSDIPPVLDWSGAVMGKFLRPVKRPVTIRLDSDIIEWLKSDGVGYQTKANGLLRYAMIHFRRARSGGDRSAGQKRPKTTRAGKKRSVRSPIVGELPNKKAPSHHPRGLNPKPSFEFVAANSS
jgi:uncharacterized protein (DUF4415 family)